MSFDSSTSSSLDDTFRIHRESLTNRTKPTSSLKTSIKHNHRSPPQPIILMISDCDQTYPERTLTPPTNGQPILVGRATAIDKQKNPLSSQPAPDNARFTCPVMSKTHAQITWITNQPYLQDTQSTHGTWYRGEQKISSSDPRSQPSTRNIPRTWEKIPKSLQLQDGMSIRFGRAITNPTSGSRYTPLEVTVRIPKANSVSQSGTYGLIDPYLTFSDDSEPEKPCTTSPPKTSITDMKKGSSKSHVSLQGPNDHSQPVAVETNTSLSVDSIDSTFQTGDPPTGSDVLCASTNSKPLRPKIPSSAVSLVDALTSLANSKAPSAVMAMSSSPPNQPKESRSSAKSIVDQLNTWDNRPLRQRPAESKPSSNYSYRNHRPSSSNSIRSTTRSITSSLSPSKSSPKKVSSEFIPSINKAPKSRVGLDEGEEPDDRCKQAKGTRLKKLHPHAEELLDDSEEKHGDDDEARGDHQQQQSSKDLEASRRIIAKKNDVEGRDSDIELVDCDSEDPSDIEEKPVDESEDEDSDLEENNSGIEEEPRCLFDDGDIDEEGEESEEAESAVDEPNTLETAGDEPIDGFADREERIDTLADLENSDNDERPKHNAQEDDGANLSSAEECPSSLPSPRANKNLVINTTRKAVSSKTFKDMSLVTTITSKTHFTESLNRMPENCVQVSFKLEPLCPSPSDEVLTGDAISSRMPLVARKSPEITSLIEPKTQDAPASASVENSQLDDTRRLTPIVNETVSSSSRLKRKRSIESIGEEEEQEAEKSVITHKSKLLKKSVAGGAVCSHCSNEMHQPKKQKLSTHVLSAARSLFIFALGGAATVAGILAFENIIDEV